MPGNILQFYPNYSTAILSLCAPTKSCAAMFLFSSFYYYGGWRMQGVCDWGTRGSRWLAQRCIVRYVRNSIYFTVPLRESAASMHSEFKVIDLS